MSDPLDILSGNLDAITSTESLTAQVLELVEISIEEIRLLITEGHDDARMTAIQKFLPVALKVMQETRDTRTEEIKAECRQMIAEMLTEPA
jgi:hypothetical protein